MALSRDANPHPMSSPTRPRRGPGPKGEAVSHAVLANSAAETEFHISARPGTGSGNFESQATQAYETLGSELRKQGIRPEDVIAEKVFLGDLAIQAPLLRKIRWEFYRHSRPDEIQLPATTLLRQPPARPGVLCEIQVSGLLRGNGSAATTREIRGLPPGLSARVFESGDLKHIHMAGVTGGRIGDALSFSQQASSMFQRAERCLTAEGQSFKDVVRTWIYIPDIDRDYDELNRVRSDFFNAEGIETFPASTGIQGTPFPPDRACGLDLRTVAGKGPLEVKTIHAPTLNEACSYGSDFSRGLRVTTQDRCVIYISGTASIDLEGNVVEVGNPEGQVHRMLENVERLLVGQGAGPHHLVSAITYLKKATFLQPFEKILRERGFPSEIPHTICVADVCRPEWLCEMEAIAIMT